MEPIFKKSVITLLFLFDTTLQKHWKQRDSDADSMVYSVGGIMSAVNTIKAKMFWSKTLNPKRPEGCYTAGYPELSKPFWTVSVEGSECGCDVELWMFVRTSLILKLYKIMLTAFISCHGTF